MRDECLETPQNCGTHAVVLTGYDLNKKVFYFKNSWGQYWGEGGYGTLTIDMIDRYTHHSSLIVELKNNIELVNDHKENLLIFEKFDVTLIDSSIDQSKKISSTVNLLNIGFHTIKIDSTLVVKPAYIYDAINDLNAEVVLLNSEDYAKFQSKIIKGQQVFLPTTGVGDFIVEDDSEGVINISSELMSTKSVTDLMKDHRQLYFKTTLYIYSDDDGYKVLNSYFHKIKY